MGWSYFDRRNVAAQRCDSLKPILYCSSTWALKECEIDRHWEIARRNNERKDRKIRKKWKKLANTKLMILKFIHLRWEVNIWAYKFTSLTNNSHYEKEVRYNFSVSFFFNLGVMGWGARGKMMCVFTKKRMDLYHRMKLGLFSWENSLRNIQTLKLLKDVEINQSKIFSSIWNTFISSQNTGEWIWHLRKRTKGLCNFQDLPVGRFSDIPRHALTFYWFHSSPGSWQTSK